MLAQDVYVLYIRKQDTQSIRSATTESTLARFDRHLSGEHEPGYNPRLTMGSAPLKTGRSTFPTEMAFQGNWRTYQARLLKRLDFYLEDERLHVVAAPGSGKTVFGLEAIRRINRPTLVLAPTITIRNQWAERLFQYFLPHGSPKPDWVSTNIRRPELLTIAKYQALHALCSGEPEGTEDACAEDETNSRIELPNGNGNENGKSATPVEVPEVLSGFETLVVDEAHHLKAEWWRTLTFVADRLKPTLVALTATHPYDVSPYEWQRYEDLCGPVDAEVALPELVLHGDLCPHEGSINSASADFQVHADRNRDGSVYCWISGGTGRDQAIFLRALREVLKPVENPRYLLARTRFWRSSARTTLRSLICSHARRIALQSLLGSGAVILGQFSLSIRVRPMGGKSSFVPECTPLPQLSKLTRGARVVGSNLQIDSRMTTQLPIPDLMLLYTWRVELKSDQAAVAKVMTKAK